ncbi:ester cyclase [Frankia sp. CiP3]|uniref:ester cyclase n=1 Tax=Frankia sp. CiP3 TaxID=2880971 RepID=UPI001EF6120C|nr:ester cyclase [Frankia sp. CiP3]
MSTDTNRTESNKAAARRLYEEVVNNGRLELLDDLIDSDADDETRARAGWSAGRDGFRQHVVWLREAVGDLKTTVTDLVAEDDRVVVFWRIEGIHKGDVFGVPATGRPIDGTSISWITFHDGRIVSYDVLPDRLTILRQIGGVPV